MTQVLIDRATLEQLVVALEKHHKQETRYSDNKRRANATCAHFTVNPLQELAEQAYMLTHGKETIEAITAGRAALANAGPTGWQKIETAPKDKSVMLHCRGFIPFYCGRKRYGNLGEPQQSELAWRCDSSGRFANPTHWMPLPTPPKDTL